MLDPRIYRLGLIAVLLAVFVFAFSLENEPGSLSLTATPTQFNGGKAFTNMNKLAEQFPVRLAGSAADNAVAGRVAGYLRGAGPHHAYSVSTENFTAETTAGSRVLQTVTGLDPGTSDGAIAVIAPRDGTGTASLSGTSVLEQLATAIGGQTLKHSILFVSTSGTAGSAGTEQVAAALARYHVEAAIVLGDLDAANTTQPLIVPWSSTRSVASPALRATLANAIRKQSGLRPTNPGVAAQVARIAFPLTLGPQGPFAAEGIPAVTLSLSGERGPQRGEVLATTDERVSGMGAAVLATIDALDAEPAIAPSSSYLSFDGKMVPFWAIRLLVLALLAPVLLVTADGVARASRRGHPILGAVGWVLAAAVPFLLGGVLMRLAKVVHAIHAAPPGPVAGGAVPLHLAGIVILLVILAVLVAAFGLLRPLCIALARSVAGPPPSRSGTEAPVTEGGGPAVLMVACAITLVLWWVNPLTALLVVPALHLWVWVVDTDLQLPRPIAVLMLVLGLIPPALILAYYAHAFAYSPIDVLWNGALLIAGGRLGIPAIVEWSVILGCLASALVIALQARSHEREQPDAITVRGPATYAGPGSLGGTNSAIRR